MKEKQTKRSDRVSGIIYAGDDQVGCISTLRENRRRLKLLRNGKRNVWRNLSF